MNAAKRELIFQTLKKFNPNPSTELEFNNGYELLVAVMLSAQSTDKQVNIATKKLFKEYSCPKKMLTLSEIELKEFIKNIGLYNTKAKNILKMSKMLINQFNGEVPNERKQLESLPGVGRKTANVVLNTLFNQPTIAVDTHLFRLGNRIGLASGKNELEVELKLLKTTPKKYLNQAHHLLILHGRYICKAVKPECFRCKINQWCEWKNKKISPSPTSINP